MRINFDYSIFIGEKFRSKKGGKIFKLESFGGFSFKFECGHWCTDNVFYYMEHIRLDCQVIDLLPAKQLELQL